MRPERFRRARQLLREGADPSEVLDDLEELLEEDARLVRLCECGQPVPDCCPVCLAKRGAANLVADRITQAFMGAPRKKKD